MTANTLTASSLNPSTFWGMDAEETDPSALPMSFPTVSEAPTVTPVVSAAASTLPELMSPGEVAQLFGVDPKTVSRWSMSGKLPAVKTLGGHRRFRREDVVKLMLS